MKLHKYLTTILFKRLNKTHIGPVNLFEEYIVFIKAKNEKELFKKAKEWALKNETSFINVFGDQIEWKFTKIIDYEETYLKEMDRLKSGMELFSRLMNNHQMKLLYGRINEPLVIFDSYLHKKLIPLILLKGYKVKKIKRGYSVLLKNNKYLTSISRSKHNKHHWIIDPYEVKVGNKTVDFLNHLRDISFKSKKEESK